MQNKPHNAPTPPSPTAANSAINRLAYGLVIGLARHWLAIFNLAWGVYVFLPLAAPVLMQAGYTVPARLIYGLYSALCHQLPDHSYFLFGSSPVPLLPTLEANGMPPGLGLLEQRRFLGNADLGYKIAICERDMAIYGSVLIAGLVFGLVRRTLSPLSLKLYLLFLIPMAIDGGTQLIGLRESNWWLRSVTGALFGVASVWLAYPYVEEAMQEVQIGEMARRPP